MAVVSKAAKKFKFFSVDAKVGPASINECYCGHRHRCWSPELETGEPVRALNERHAAIVFKREYQKENGGERIVIIAIREATPEEICGWINDNIVSWGTTDDDGWVWPAVTVPHKAYADDDPDGKCYICSRAAEDPLHLIKGEATSATRQDGA